MRQLQRRDTTQSLNSPMQRARGPRAHAQILLRVHARTHTQANGPTGTAKTKRKKIAHDPEEKERSERRGKRRKRAKEGARIHHQEAALLWLSFPPGQHRRSPLTVMHCAPLMHSLSVRMLVRRQHLRINGTNGEEKSPSALPPEWSLSPRVLREWGVQRVEVVCLSPWPRSGLLPLSLVATGNAALYHVFAT